MRFNSAPVQRLRRLLGAGRRERPTDTIVVEGAILLAEAHRAGWEVVEQFVAPTAEPLDVATDVVHRCAAGVVERVSRLSSSPGLIAVVRRGDAAVVDLTTAAFVVVADQVSEPGNLGTILRSAEAAGADAVVVTPGTVDVGNDKVVRASAGAIFHLPTVVATLDEVGAAGLRRVGTSSHRGSSDRDADWSGRVAIVMGNEAAGLDDDAAIDDWVRIEHHGRAESLNVAMAATLLCFDAARQRSG